VAGGSTVTFRPQMSQLAGIKNFHGLRSL